jgi:hypothetical protein
MKKSEDSKYPTSKTISFELKTSDNVDSVFEKINRLLINNLKVN